MIKRPKKMSNGLPRCNEEILYLLWQNNGVMTRKEVRDTLLKMGYGKYCIYEAFRRVAWREEVEFIGGGTSPNQKLVLKVGEDNEKV